MPSTPEAKRVARANRAARKRGLPAALSTREWFQTLNDFKWLCAYCGEYGVTIDHFIPMAWGGGTTIQNCVPSCTICNNRKGGQLPKHLSWVSKERLKEIQHYLQQRGEIPYWNNERLEQEKFIPSLEHKLNLSQGNKGESMSTKETHNVTITFPKGKEIRILSDMQNIVLQIRQLPPNTDEMIASSTQEHVQLSATAATALALELLRFATPILEQPPRSSETTEAPQKTNQDSFVY